MTDPSLTHKEKLETTKDGLRKTLSRHLSDDYIDLVMNGLDIAYALGEINGGLEVQAMYKSRA